MANTRHYIGAWLEKDSGGHWSLRSTFLLPRAGNCGSGGLTLLRSANGWAKVVETGQSGWVGTARLSAVDWSAGVAGRGNGRLRPERLQKSLYTLEACC